MTGTALFAHQFRIDLLRFWRNPQSRYFTVLLPIVFLVIFAAIFKGTTIVEGRTIKLTTFYVPGIMTLGIISATFVNLTQAVVTQRESGELKRAPRDAAARGLRDLQPRSGRGRRRRS